MTLDERIELMIEYLQMKMDLRDWHAVADAAMDLREMEVERRLTTQQQQEREK